MEKKAEIIENFKTAISSTIKSLSNSEKVEVSFGNQNIKSEKSLIKLPEIEKINNKINYDQIRALADSESLRLRFSNLNIFKTYEPEGNISKKLYKIAEKIRYEKLGSDQFKGVKNNIQKHYKDRIHSLDFKIVGVFRQVAVKGSRSIALGSEEVTLMTLNHFVKGTRSIKRTHSAKSGDVEDTQPF